MTGLLQPGEYSSAKEALCVASCGHCLGGWRISRWCFYPRESAPEVLLGLCGDNGEDGVVVGVCMNQFIVLLCLCHKNVEVS